MSRRRRYLPSQGYLRMHALAIEQLEFIGVHTTRPVECRGRKLRAFGSNPVGMIVGLPGRHDANEAVCIVDIAGGVLGSFRVSEQRPLADVAILQARGRK